MTILQVKFYQCSQVYHNRVYRDEAAAAVLKAFREAKMTPRDRPVLTHCQVLGEDLLLAMQKEGIIANIQPQFVHTDSLWAEKRLPSRTYLF